MIIQKAVGARINDQNLLGERQWRKLFLLEYLDQPLSTIELGLRGFVEIAAELRESRQFAELRQIEFHSCRQPGAWL